MTQNQAKTLINAMYVNIFEKEKRLGCLYQHYAPEIETEPLYREIQHLKDKLKSIIKALGIRRLINYEVSQRLHFKKEFRKFWQERKIMRKYIKRCIFCIRYFDKEIKANRLWLKEVKVGV